MSLEQPTVNTSSLYNQSHSGPGDNVGRDKYEVNVYKQVAPENLRTNLEEIMSNLRVRNKEKAKNTISILKNTGLLSTESIAVLDMLAIHTDMLEEKEHTEARSTLVRFLKEEHSLLAKDLCLASLIRLNAKNGLTEEAKKLFCQSEYKGIYSNEVFYELIADGEKLAQKIEEEHFSLTEEEMTGVVRGALRLENYDLSLRAATHLKSNFDTYNSQVLLLFAEVGYLLNIKVAGKLYWSITASLKNEVLGVVKQIILLINESKGQEGRLFHLALPFLYFLAAEHPELSATCWKYIEEVEKVNSETASVLRSIYEKQYSGLDDIQKKFKMALDDVEFKNRLMDEMLAKKDISPDSVLLFIAFSTPEQVQAWSSSGGEIIGKDTVALEFSKLEMKTFILEGEKNLELQKKLKKQVEDFVENYSNDIEKINPNRLYNLTKSLLRIDLGESVCQILQVILPKSDLWVSSLVEVYLNALLQSEQFQTLDRVLKNINKEEWDDFVWHVQARVYNHQNNQDAAIEAMKKAIEINSQLLNRWHFLVHLMAKYKKSDEEIAEVLKGIPDKLLSTPSEESLSLLIEIARTGDFNRAEKLIVLCFLKNPESSAKFVSDFSLFIMMVHLKSPYTLSVRIDKCSGGARFIRDGREQTMLFVDDDTPNHHSFLASKSPMGELLSSMIIGETRQYGMQKITLEESLPPYVAVMRVAMSIRDLRNDGTDTFYQFQLPTKPDGMLNFFKEKMEMLDAGKNKDVTTNSEIPLYVKGNVLHSNEPIQAALELFQLRNKITPTRIVGYGVEAAEKAVIDVYGIIYLALSGLAYGLTSIQTTFVITFETKEIIEHFLKTVSDPEYLSLGLDADGELYRATAEDLKNSTTEKRFQEALHYVLSQVEIEAPKLVDLPLELVRLKEVLDVSVYTSMAISVSNKLPWLCMDEVFARVFSDNGEQVLNSATLLSEMSKHVDFATKKIGLYLHFLASLPYVLTYEDLIGIAGTDDKEAHFIVSGLLRKSPDMFSDSETASSILSLLLIKIIVKGYAFGIGASTLYLEPDSEKAFYSCCFVAIQNKDGLSAEQKLAMMLYKLYPRFSNLHLVNKMIDDLVAKFSRGHFLNVSQINMYLQLLFEKDNSK